MSSILDDKFTIRDIRNGKLIFEKKIHLLYVNLRECVFQFYYFLYTLKSILQTTKEETVVGVK